MAIARRIREIASYDRDELAEGARIHMMSPDYPGLDASFLAKGNEGRHEGEIVVTIKSGEEIHKVLIGYLAYIVPRETRESRTQRQRRVVLSESTNNQWP